jgi:hypothetical protein
VDEILRKLPRTGFRKSLIFNKPHLVSHVFGIAIGIAIGIGIEVDRGNRSRSR